jgi:hypothetical protein
MDIIQTPKKNVIFDATLLSGMACGRFFDFRYNHNFVQRTGKSNSLECGSLVHVILEHYYNAIIARMKRTDAIGFGFTAGQLYVAGCIHCTDFTPLHNSVDPAEANGKEHNCNEQCIVKPECGHKPNSFPGVHNTPADSEGYVIGWKWVFETMQQYFDYYKNDFWIPLEVECVKREVIFEDDQIRVMWKAKLDVIMDTNQAIMPMDHKTMKQNREVVDLNNQFEGQCFLTHQRSVVIDKIGFQRSLKPEQKFIRPIITYTADRLLEWQSEIVPYYAYRLLEYSESGYYPPDYTRCEGKFGNCVFMDVCKADRNMREQELNINFVVGQKWDVGNEDD